MLAEIDTTLLWRKLSLSSRDGRLSSFLLLEERCLLIQSWLQYQIVSCKGWLSRAICAKKLDKVNRDFLWSSSLEKRKLHLVGWNKVIRSKAEGGVSSCRQQGQKTLLFLQSLIGDSTKTRILFGLRFYWASIALNIVRILLILINFLVLLIGLQLKRVFPPLREVFAGMWGTIQS